jgi:hypothetical protein
MELTHQRRLGILKYSKNIHPGFPAAPGDPVDRQFWKWIPGWIRADFHIGVDIDSVLPGF